MISKYETVEPAGRALQAIIISDKYIIGENRTGSIVRYTKFSTERCLARSVKRNTNGNINI